MSEDINIHTHVHGWPRTRADPVTRKCLVLVLQIENRRHERIEMVLSSMILACEAKADQRHFDPFYAASPSRPFLRAGEPGRSPGAPEERDATVVGVGGGKGTIRISRR